jgi:hypothetical protein
VLGLTVLYTGVVYHTLTEGVEIIIINVKYTERSVETILFFKVHV